MQMLECCPHPASPAQPSPARHKSLALNFSEWNLLIRWDYRHYSQSSPPATGHRAQPGVDYTKKLFDNVHLFNLSSNLDNVNVDDVVEF